MKFTLFSIVAFLASNIAATPFNATPFGKRALTPDNTCGLQNGGNNMGYTCNPSLAQGGSCCSSSGYCGNSDAYCGTGCQSAYGTCGTSTTSTTPTTSQTTTSTTSSASGPVGTSTDVCGAANGNTICAPGYCCSPNGYCGTSDAYCGTGCQSTFGQCGVSTPTTTGTPAPGPTGSTTVCGPSNGNAVCATGLCCSPSGYCGTGEAYCTDPDCLYQYGTCDSNTTPAGQSTINDPRPALGSVSYSADIYDCVKPNVVALTYDDGPLNYTSKLLDVLAQYNFKATFFITGNNLGKGAIDVTAPYPSVIRRMIAEGHQVASHTWSHYDLSTLTHDLRVQQMVKNERAIANIIGKYPTYMRPPYSSCDQQSGCWADLQALGYHRTYFDLDTQDYLNDAANEIQNSKNIVKWALGNATQGSDFLSIQHDIHYQSVYNLSSYYFDLIQAKGWKGVTVGDCLGDDQANWYRVPGTGQAAPPVSSSSSTSPTSTSSSTTSTKSTTTSTATKPTTTTTSTKTTSTATKPTTTATVGKPVNPTGTSTTNTKDAQATQACDYKAANFCGTIKSFNTQAGCQSAASNCGAQWVSCGRQASRASCAQWLAECGQLMRYCQSCGRSCSDRAFVGMLN